MTKKISLNWPRQLAAAWAVVCFLFLTPMQAAESGGVARFSAEIEPFLKEYCHDCHADGANKGNVAFDEFSSAQAALENHELWLKALKNLRASLMPPPKKPQPTAEEKERVIRWIKKDVFQIDPRNPDPGRVTVRRLNRTEYRNTVRDLLGVDFDTDKEFPPDDSGHGFDNISEALTLPPMLLEKYLAAAKSVVSKAVPVVAKAPAVKNIPGRAFSGEVGPLSRTNRGSGQPGALTLSYYETGSVSNVFQASQPGSYQLQLDFAATERFVDNQFDYNKCRLLVKVDGQEFHNRVYTREGNKAFHYDFDLSWAAGDHVISIQTEPLTPDEKQIRSLAFRIESVTLRGPLEPARWIRAPNYERFFPRDPPEEPAARRAYAREVLQPFLLKAFRRPVEKATMDKLVTLAETIYTRPGNSFEAGIAQAMIAALASPRFLFREEAVEELSSGNSSSAHPYVDEFALASRLSYFFWSSLPDDELLRLASAKQLRANLAEQTRRLLADKKSEALVRNFAGQWLQTRDIDSIQIDARQVLGREAPPDPDFERRRARFRELRDKPEESLTPEEKKEIEAIRGTFFRRFGQSPRAELTGDLRRAFRLETEKAFEYILREDRGLLELVESDYTFLNERLARHYGLTNLNISGEELTLVKLPPDSPRGGILTHGSVLVVTSNPTRTSPVKRGLFILENLLGTPPAPPPPDIPPLEDAARQMQSRTLTLRETLALHREAPLCSSCHNRMDPLGLALENFNALGMWRDQERGQPIDAAGQLLSGEKFSNIKELKRILAEQHDAEFYRTVTEKMLTYALGRGLEYYDVETVDRIVEQLEQSKGRPSVLLAGIIQSAPFQKTRALDKPEKTPASNRAAAN